ncbi:hypothetical protein [Neorhodopirellula lusitana]|uniref:hypothetical protein n=1 Tax=Neorhodopirellula lusitana TaxID=445327 RepID=UPI00385005C2
MPEQGTLAGKTEDEITVAVGKKQWRFAFPASYSVRQAIGTDHCLGGIDARRETRDARREMRDARCEMRDARCEMRDAWLGDVLPQEGQGFRASGRIAADEDGIAGSKPTGSKRTFGFLRYPRVLTRFFMFYASKRTARCARAPGGRFS